tara:strand:+ start:2241 stop:3182 length:942 start_codon:yes stop_codon:yes gene_type:complete
MSDCNSTSCSSPQIPLTNIADSQTQEYIPQPVVGVGEIVLVASGKGGVGKSTVTVNLAASLHSQGLRVGVLDADLYGPSIARMFGAGEGLQTDSRGIAQPTECHGVFVLSVASVMPPEAALVWKGPLVTQTLTQMFREVLWPDIDVLLVDLPPGTGDIQLTILEQFPISGALVVTTPQRLAVTDARRAISMFHELDIPVFGLIENMDGYLCPCCGERQQLFPTGAAKQLASDRSVTYLGGIAIDPTAQAFADSGQPIVMAQADGTTALRFHELAEQVSSALLKEQKYRAFQARESGHSNDSRHTDFWEPLLDE